MKKANWLLVLSGLLLWTGCWYDRDTVRYESLTEAEVTAFGDSLMAALEFWDADFISACSDVYRTVDRTETRNLASHAELRDMTRTLQQNNVFLQYLLDPAGPDFWSTHYLTRIRMRDSVPVIQLRLTDENGGFSYVDVLVEKRIHGDTVKNLITDVYAYNTGGWISQTMHESIRIMRPGEGAASNEGLFQVIMDKFKEGEYDKAVEYISGMEEDLRNSRFLLQLRLQAAMQIGDSAVKDAMDAYHAVFPRSPALAIHSLAYLRKQKAYTKSLQAVGNIEAALGGTDALLTYERFTILSERGDYAAAQKLIPQIDAMEPEADYAQFARFYGNLDQKKWKSAVEAGKALEAKGYDKFTFDFTGYAEFLLSSEYDDWMADSTDFEAAYVQ